MFLCANTKHYHRINYAPVKLKEKHVPFPPCNDEKERFIGMVLRHNVRLGIYIVGRGQVKGNIYLLHPELPV